MRLSAFIGVAGLLLQLAPTASATCSDLAALKLANTTITAAQPVASGRFVLPSDSPRADSSFFTAFDTLAAFCRVQGVIEAVPGSHVEFEVWLPMSQWNGRYIGAGNGGYSGAINYYRLAEAVRDGSVGSATDAGHKTADVRWWDGHPERVVDWDHRAIHETAVKAKAIIAAFYGRPQAHAYFISCSNGGRQGIVEALRYPADYDGILAGAPAYAFGAELSPHPLSAAQPPDLRAFKRRGGKLIIYHGGEDQPAASVDFHRKLVAILGKGAVDEFVRLYVVPGMGHCGGVPDLGERLRPGQDPAHSVARALQAWVETGLAPRASSIAEATVWQPTPGHTQLPLWSGVPPDAQQTSEAESVATTGNDHLVAGRPWTFISNVSRPTITVYSPKEKNTSAAVVVFPGGGYQILAIDLEGTEVCDWLTSRGITCVLLKYRVPGLSLYPKSAPYPKSGPYPQSPIALVDAQRAVGLVRSHAAECSYYAALKKAGVPVEMHLYAQGGHAFGLRRTKFPATAWPRLVETWLETIGVLSH